MVVLWLFLVCVCHRVIGQINSASGSLINESGGIADTDQDYSEKKENYQPYDPQMLGFNSTKIKSDPIVLVDTKTIFIPNLRYNGENKTLNFWAGNGSPYSQSKFVTEKEFLGNHSNIYVNFHQPDSVDTIDFFSIGNNNTAPIDYVVFAKVNRSEIQPHDANSIENQKNIYRIPKCCHHSQTLQSNGFCGDTDEPIILDLPIYVSNASGLDPNLRLNKSEYEIRPYVNSLICEGKRDVRITPLNEYGLIYNSSLIIKEDSIRHLGQFCIDQYMNETIALVCYAVNSEEASISPNIYLPVLFVSMICFATSAGIYCFILKVKDIHKRCFIAFSVSMTITFFSLILLQMQSHEGACNAFGFLFIFFTILSFCWLGILCLDLLYKVRCFRENEQKSQRFFMYICMSLATSIIILLISLFSGENFIPDVPPSFVKPYGGDKCEFYTTTSRIFIFFTPMAISFVVCIICLSVIPCYFRINDKNSKNDCDWVENKNSCKYLLTSYTVLAAISCFWLVNVAFNFLTMNGMTQLALDVIEASLGIVTISIFIFNKYTMREIKQKLYGKKPKLYVTEEMLSLNGFGTPVTPRTPASDTSEPSFSINNSESLPTIGHIRTFNTFNR